jgi:type VI secretion system secreted protein Hcp
MPSISSSPAPASPGSRADIYLHLQTRRAGKIKGEATSTGHVDDILVLGWQWGLQASSALGVTAQSERRSYTALTLHKAVDRATTGLMSAVATNDEVKEARLALRRPGGEQEIYFSITIKNARVTSLHHSTDEFGHPQETITIAFTKVEVEYRPQLTSGQRGGSTTFTDEILAA